MLSEAAPASLHQALPSSVQQLLLHAVPQHVSPAPPAATAERCEAIAALFDQECMRRATGGGGWTLTPARNGACEPPDAAAAGLASGAVQRCGPRLLVQLGYSKLWNTANPFEFMEMISMTAKTNMLLVRLSPKYCMITGGG